MAKSTVGRIGEARPEGVWPRVYRIRRGQRIFAGGFGVAAIVGGFVGAGAVLLGKETHPAVALLPLLFVALGGYLVAAVTVERIALYAHAIEFVELGKGTRRLRRDEIAGLRIVPLKYGYQQLVFELRGGEKKLEFNWAHETDPVLDAWLAAIPNRDAEERARHEAELLASPELGADEADRRRTLDRARTEARVLNGVAVAVGLWGWLSPRPYAAAIVALVVFPLVPIALILTRRGLYALDPRRNDPRPMLGTAILGPGLVLGMRAVLDVHALDWQWLLAAAALGGLALVIAIGQSERPELRTSPWLLAAVAPFFAAYPGGALTMANTLLDPGTPRVFRVEVRGQSVSSGRHHTSWDLELAPWGDVIEPTRVDVGRGLYQSVSVGQRVCVALHPGALGARWYDVGRCPDTPDENAARELRQQAAADLAPAPLPAPQATADQASPLPLLGEDGSDQLGFPRRYVDRVTLRALLLRGRFPELTRAVEGLQDAFERDRSLERWPDDAAEALGTAEKELLAKLDAWVAAEPRSFAPHLARGAHWVNAAYARRGGKWAEDTPDSDFDGMKDALDRALPDLHRALALRPGLVAAMNQLLRAYRLAPGGQVLGRRVVDAALRTCPSCFAVDATYQYSLLPRWGGSYREMEAYAKRRSTPGNPRAGLLLGFIDVDRSEAPRHQGRHEEALAHVERACRRGEYWSFLVERADIELAMAATDKALADLDRAAELRPGHPEVLYARARALGFAKRYEEAARDVRAGLAADPAHWRVRSGASRLVSRAVAGLMIAGWQRFERGDREGAIRDYDLATELDPGNHEVQGRRAYIVAGGTTAPAALAKKLEEAQANVPDDFRAVQQLDYQLARERRFEPVVALWSAFLAKHPDHGPAYLERGGAYFNLGKAEEAVADARKACDLGVSEGCLHAKQLGGGR